MSYGIYGSYRMSDGEREIWDEMQRDAAPTVTKLSQDTHRARKQRKLSCGHTIQPGQWYEEWVGLVDGEFSIEHHCEICYDRMMEVEYQEYDMDEEEYL